MHFEFTPKVKELQQKLSDFMNEHIYPNEKLFYDRVHLPGPQRFGLLAVSGLVGIDVLVHEVAQARLQGLNRGAGVEGHRASWGGMHRGGCRTPQYLVRLGAGLSTWAQSLRVFRSCPLITPKDARSSLQMLAIARAMAALCAWIGRL